jgi:hypothetical protein
MFMDHVCNSDRSMDAGNRLRLHNGWVYSYPAHIRGSSCGDTVDQSSSSHLNMSVSPLFSRRAIALEHRRAVRINKNLPLPDLASSGHFVVALSLVLSLAIIAIGSKHHVSNSLWFDVAAVAVPIPIVLYFENQIVRFGIFTCVAAIVLPLTAAVLFGI